MYLHVRNSKQSALVAPAQVRETSWLGGRILLTNSELYPRYRAQQPHSLFPTMLPGIMDCRIMGKVVFQIVQSGGIRRILV